MSCYISTHWVCRCSLSLPRLQGATWLFSSVLFLFLLPWALLPSHLPLSAAQCLFQFKLKSDSLSLAFASPPPVASLVIYYLTQSPYYICTGTISEYGCYEKKLGSKPEANSPLFSTFLLIPLSFCTSPGPRPPEGPTSEHGSGR